jgi:AraC-like DNA-binding protein
MQELLFLCSGIAIGSMLLIILKLIKDCKGLPSSILLILMLLGAITYVLQPFMQAFPQVITWLNVVSITVAPLFWMFTSTLFNRHVEFRLKPYHYICLFCVLVLGGFHCFSHRQTAENIFIHYLLLALNFTFVGLGLSKVFRNWQYDLVECRRRLRMSLSTITGLLLIIALGGEFEIGASAQTGFMTNINIVLIALFAVFKAYWMLIANPNGLLESIDNVSDKLVTKDESDTPIFSVGDQRWLAALANCMEDNAYYRRNDLTIRNLSDHLNIPEHHLRRLINQHLGYRNFNDYLNRYRVKEAAQRLQDPEQSRLPILTIAIESGYASLTPFNKAFKALKEMTPSEYRRAV